MTLEEDAKRISILIGSQDSLDSQSASRENAKPALGHHRSSSHHAKGPVAIVKKEQEEESGKSELLIRFATFLHT